MEKSHSFLPAGLHVEEDIFSFFSSLAGEMLAILMADTPASYLLYVWEVDGAFWYC